MSLFNIITPCSRPENLQQLYRSIVEAEPDFTQLKWVIVHDRFEDFKVPGLNLPWIEQYHHHGGIVGHDQRNYALDHVIKEGYVYSLDDDTVLHRNFFKVLNRAIRETNKKGYIFWQELEDGTYRKNDHDNTTIWHIDNGQFLLHRDLIGSLRYCYAYFADGIFIEILHKAQPEDFEYIPECLSYYNRLRWKSV